VKLEHIRDVLERFEACVQLLEAHSSEPEIESRYVCHSLVLLWFAAIVVIVAVAVVRQLALRHYRGPLASHIVNGRRREHFDCVFSRFFRFFCLLHDWRM
jgi:hypothetical protein